MIDQRRAVAQALSALGFNIIHWNENPNTPGVDCWAQREGKSPVSIEVKLLLKRSGCWSCDAVSGPRRNDDLVAIIFNESYVLIEPMSQHLKCCAPKGTRSFPGM